MDASRYSVRIGAAMTEAANGVSDATIQILGCWKIDSYSSTLTIANFHVMHVTEILQLITHWPLTLVAISRSLKQLEKRWSEKGEKRVDR